MSDEFIYGYGSLVNRATHAYPSYPARLVGWRRTWRHTSARSIAYLSAIQDENHSIDGLIMQVTHGDKELDQREAAYTRHDVSDSVKHEIAGPTKVHVYAVPEDPDAGLLRHPIFLSYIDVVSQGYYQLFGEIGVRQFFGTTDGWDTVILDDRDNPQYPRHQSLSRAEIKLTDVLISQLPAMVKKL